MLDLCFRSLHARGVECVCVVDVEFWLSKLPDSTDIEFRVLQCNMIGFGKGRDNAQAAHLEFESEVVQTPPECDWGISLDVIQIIQIPNSSNIKTRSRPGTINARINK